MPRPRHHIQAGQATGQGPLPSTASRIQRVNDAGIRLNGSRSIGSTPSTNVTVGTNESGHDDLVGTVLNQSILGDFNGRTHGKNFSVLHQQGAPLNFGAFNRE